MMRFASLTASYEKYNALEQALCPSVSQNLRVFGEGFGEGVFAIPRRTRDSPSVLHIHVVSPALLRVNWSTATARTITTPITIN